MSRYFIKDIDIVNEGSVFRGSVYISDGIISGIYKENEPEPAYDIPDDCITIEGKGRHLLPGIIDDQVHFREPGLTHKADISSESKAAVAGGITSYLEMPNTNPPALSLNELNRKYDIAAEHSLANYSFYMGASNENVAEIKRINPGEVCGVKVFMGSSTGNMLVDDREVLSRIFNESPVLVAVHCEDETTIKRNIQKYIHQYGENLPINYHPLIRSEDACFKSSSYAVELAGRYNTRLHVLHLSTSKELSLFDNSKPAKDKQITAEVCIHHLWFDDSDYEKYSTRIKWNPAIKTRQDKEDLFSAVLDDRIDVVATDHAPHLLSEKKGGCLQAASEGPMVQHSLQVMLEFFRQGSISLEKIVEKMSHAPADIFKIDRRGYIRNGYHADLVIVDLNKQEKVTRENILYKCGWSPFEDAIFHSGIIHTFVNGRHIFDEGKFNVEKKGAKILFNR